MHTFDKATQLKRISRPGERTAVYRGNVISAYTLGKVPNGGYSLAVLQCALHDHFNKRHDHPATVADKDGPTALYPHPLVMQVRYLQRVDIGPCYVEIMDINTSRNFATAIASLCQPKAARKEDKGQATTVCDDEYASMKEGSAYPDGHDLGTRRVYVMATYGNMVQNTSSLLRVDHFTTEKAPGLASDAWLERSSKFPPIFPITENLDIHVELDHVLNKQPITHARVRFAQISKPGASSSMSRAIDIAAIPLIADCLRAPLVHVGDEVLGGHSWFPTVSLDMHFKAEPSPGTEWVSLVGRTRFVDHGRHEFDVEVWEEPTAGSGSSRMLALVRQYAVVVPWIKNVKSKAKGPHLMSNM